MEKVQKERDELLATTIDELRGLGRYIRAFMENECLCVVGNGEKIKESEDMFMHVEQLFRNN